MIEKTLNLFGIIYVDNSNILIVYFNFISVYCGYKQVTY